MEYYINHHLEIRMSLDKTKSQKQTKMENEEKQFVSLKTVQQKS